VIYTAKAGSEHAKESSVISVYRYFFISQKNERIYIKFRTNCGMKMKELCNEKHVSTTITLSRKKIAF